MPRLAALMILAMLGLAGPAAAADVYKCTGADGKTYYTGTPCPAGAEEKRLDVPKAPPRAESQVPRKSLDERIAEATDPVVKAQLEIEKQRCELARTQLERYENAPYLIQRKDDGSERRLSDEEAAAEMQRLRQQIAERC